MLSSVGPSVTLYSVQSPVQTAVGPSVTLLPTMIEDSTVGPSVVMITQSLEQPLPIQNLGPRVKQIRRLRNDTSIPEFNDVLGSAVNNTDWISPGDLSDFVVPSIVGGRITTGNDSSTPGDPVTGSTLSTANFDVFYVPFKHNIISLYDGSKWNYHRFDAFTTTLGSAAIINGSVAASTNYDVYVYDNNGQLALEYAAWSNNTPGSSVRDVSFSPVRLDGVLVANYDSTRRYVGTVRTDIFNGTFIPTTEVTSNRNLFGVWNYYNQVKQSLSYTLNTSTFPSYVTTGTGNFVALAGSGTPIILVCGYPSQMRCSFQLRFQMIAVGGTSTIAQQQPDYRARTGCSLTFNGSSVGVIGWRPLDTLGSTTNSQDRVLQIGKSAGRFHMLPGANTLSHLYGVEQLPIPDLQGFLSIGGTFELELWR